MTNSSSTARSTRARSAEQAKKSPSPAAKASKAKSTETSVTTAQLTSLVKGQTAIDVAKQNVAAKVNEGVGVTLHTNGKPIKGLAAEPIVAKPTRKHAQKIGKIIGHPGKGNCIKRFHLYKEGMTMLQCKTTEGLIWSDVTFYSENGYLTIVEGTDEEYAAMVKAWEAGKTKTAEADESQVA